MNNFADFGKAIQKIQNAISDLAKTRTMKDVTVPVNIVLSDNKEEAINRYQYEKYLKTGSINVDPQSKKKISNKVNNLAKNFIKDTIVTKINSVAREFKSK